MKPDPQTLFEAIEAAEHEKYKKATKTDHVPGVAQGQIIEHAQWLTVQILKYWPEEESE